MFRFVHQIRLASVVVQIAGIIFKSLPLMAIGLIVMVATYQYSLSMIEDWIEKQKKED